MLSLGYSRAAYFRIARPDRGLNLPNAKKLGSEPIGDQKTSWAATYYPNIADAAAAAPIVARGGDMPGYDIRLRFTTVFRIHRVALDEGGVPSPESRSRCAMPIRRTTPRRAPTPRPFPPPMAPSSSPTSGPASGASTASRAARPNSPVSLC